MFGIANYRGVMIGLLSSAALAVAQVTLSAPAGSQPEPTAFLVEVQEGTTDLSRQGASGHICVLVLPDRRFHLESRTQLLPGAEATLNLSDYSLDSSQLQQLRNLLDDEKMRQLPTFVQPAIPHGRALVSCFECEDSSIRGCAVCRVLDLARWNASGVTQLRACKRQERAARIGDGAAAAGGLAPRYRGPKVGAVRHEVHNVRQ